jgi:hypothetical protein
VQALRDLQPDIVVVMAYGQILSQEVLDVPTVACINAHASLLPRHRGAACIQAAIEAGDDETGITVMHVVRKLDAGDIICRAVIPLQGSETGESLHDDLALLAPAVVLDAIEGLRTFFLDAANSIHNDGSQIEGTFDSLAQLVENFWTVAKPLLERVVELFSAAFDHIGQYAIDGIESALKAIGYFFYGLTALINGDFEGFWDGIEKMSTHGANAIIAVFNGLLEAVAAAINAIFTALNKVTIDIPGWVPVYGGKKFQFDLKPVKAHPVPYLAQGAVLPANKPFLAVVGDQKHGTNIEAPLATIQQAVALTMEDVMAQNAAGQEATVAVLSQILQAVLGISIGDEQLAAAVDRYHSHAAVMRGGNGWN